jgi:hypothetical protein
LQHAPRPRKTTHPHPSETRKRCPGRPFTLTYGLSTCRVLLSAVLHSQANCTFCRTVNRAHIHRTRSQSSPQAAASTGMVTAVGISYSSDKRRRMPHPIPSPVDYLRGGGGFTWHAGCGVAAAGRPSRGHHVASSPTRIVNSKSAFHTAIEQLQRLRKHITWSVIT